MHRLRQITLMQHEIGAEEEKRKIELQAQDCNLLFSIWWNYITSVNTEFNLLNRTRHQLQINIYLMLVRIRGWCVLILSQCAWCNIPKTQKTCRARIFAFSTHGVKAARLSKSRCDDISQNIWIKIFRFFYKCLLCLVWRSGRLLD